MQSGMVRTLQLAQNTRRFSQPENSGQALCPNIAPCPTFAASSYRTALASPQAPSHGRQ
jgi:hypothetical protein